MLNVKRFVTQLTPISVSNKDVQYSKFPSHYYPIKLKIKK